MNPMMNIDKSTLTASELRIAEYIENNVDYVVKLTIHELASEIKVSPSSITRFTRKLNYASFADMRIDLVRNLDAHTVQSFNRLLQWNSVETEQLSQNFIDLVTSVFHDVLTLNSTGQFDLVSEWIRQADTVFLFGVGASRLIAQDLQQKLMKLRKRCIYNEDGNFAVQNAVLTTPSDLVVAVSYSGRTREILVASSNAKQNGCKVVAITRAGKSPLSQLADLVLAVPPVEPDARLTTIFSRYAQSFMVDILFLNYANKIDEKPEKLLESYRTLFDSFRE